MRERKESCQRQIGMDCRGCEVAVNIARNVLAKPGESVVASIEEIALNNCPEGTKFILRGDFRELIGEEVKVIQLRIQNGKPKTDREVPAAAEAAV